jgi:hypothetical protein
MGKRTYTWPRKWGPWDEYTQLRRPDPGRIEIRRSVPPALLAGLLSVPAAIDMVFFSVLIPRRGFSTALLLVSVGILVFFLGRGVTIDASRRQVRRWWGFGCTCPSCLSVTTSPR